MSLKSNMAVAAVTVAVSGAAVLGANSVSAQTTGDSLVDKISSKFGVSSDEVQVVFDEHREERKAEREAKMSEHLQELVDSGTITADQKTLIETEKDKIREAMGELKPENKDELSYDEREALHEQFKELKDSFHETLEENGIDLSDIRGEREMKGFRSGRFQ